MVNHVGSCGAELIGWQRSGTPVGSFRFAIRHLLFASAWSYLSDWDIRRSVY
jgi:hypothetical protein